MSAGRPPIAFRVSTAGGDENADVALIERRISATENFVLFAIFVAFVLQ
jgi:hypothetical protein